MSQTKAQVNKLLTDVSNGLFPTGYIAEKVLPLLSVKQKTGILGSYGEEHLRIEDDLVGGRAQAKRVDPIVRKVDNFYSVGSHALEDVVTEDDYDNVEEPFEAESDTTLGLTSLILTNKEKALASALFSTTVFAGRYQSFAGNQLFSDFANSKPLDAFVTAHGEVLDGCGMEANAAVMSLKVKKQLKFHPQILENLGFSANRAGTLSDQELAKALDVEQIFVGGVPYNSSKKGQTSTLAQVWGNSILFFHRPSAAAKRQVSLGYYIRMKSRSGKQVYKYAIDNPVNSNGIIVKDDYSHQLTNVKAGYLLSGVL